MKMTILTTALCCVSSLIIAEKLQAQSKLVYIAPQDTVSKRLQPASSLNRYSNTKVQMNTDTRLLGAAVNAARILKDTMNYNAAKGVLITNLFSEADLQYVAGRGMPSVVALFEQVNKQLPQNRKIAFVTDSSAQVTNAANPLVLDSLRMKISAQPAQIDVNRQQWKENVYLAYMARDYGTKLENTITITSATREMRERPDLEVLLADGSVTNLGKLLQQQKAKGLNGAKAEQAAVQAFRMLTYPNSRISRGVANENYRRALLALIDLQESDFQQHIATQQLIARMKRDLSLGENSAILNAIKNSSFFDANVPGNLGPVLLTEDRLADPIAIAKGAEAKAMELLSLTALHYGERDALKLYNRILDGQAALPAAETGDFSPKRLAELRYHGVEKIKSLGFGPDKTSGMRIADLVLVAVAAPELPQTSSPAASITLMKVGQTILASYNKTETTETKNVFLFGPRLSLGSRHTEYVAAYDPVRFANDSPVSQDGFEFRLESDLYFSNPAKLLDKGVKPFIYPEFGIIFGSGKRRVGYEEQPYKGPHGTVPRFKQNYLNWGGHAGLNVGPVLVSIDATILSTPNAGDPYQRFFDLSQSMTYYRYSFLARVLNLGIGKPSAPRPWFLSLDVEMAGETNNEGTLARTHTQDGGTQIEGKEWQRAYDRARPNGVYNQAIATQMILNGDVKAAYPSANYAAAHIGIQREAFQLKLTAGLYNHHAIEAYGESKAEWIRHLMKNTFAGSGFAAASLTYNIGWKGRKEKYRTRTESSTYNGLSSDPKSETSSSSEKISGSLRNRALIMNRR